MQYRGFHMPDITQNLDFQEFQRESIELQAADPHSADLSSAYAMCMQESPQFSDWIITMSEERRREGPFSPGHSVRLKRYLAQQHMLAQDPDLTNGYPDTNQFRDLLLGIFETNTAKIGYEIDHSYLNPVTSKQTRYYGSLLVAGMLTVDKDEPYSQLDIGCGPNIGLAFEEAFMSRDHPQQSTLLPRPPQLARDEDTLGLPLQKILERARTRSFEKSFGVDIFHPHDELADKWSTACQLPAALLDIDLKNQRKHLQHVRDTSDKISFIHADASTMCLRSLQSANQPKKYKTELLPHGYTADVSSAFYLLYMLNPEQAKTTIDTMLDISRYALVLDAILDVKKPHPKKHPYDQLQFAQSWGDWSTALVLYDREKPEQGWSPVARFKDGGCKVIAPEPLLLASINTLLQRT